MVIQHNLSAMNANKSLGTIKKKTTASMEKLSSGYRINKAADDAAGLTISEKMRSQIRGLMKAENNLSDGIGLVQVADGALQETHNMLQRIRELSIQSANGTNTELERAVLQKEAAALTEAIDSIAHETSFNGIYPLLGGSSNAASGAPAPGYSSSLGNVILSNNGSVSIFAKEDPADFIGSTDSFGVCLRVIDGTTTKNITLGGAYRPPGFETSGITKTKISDTEFEYEYQDAASGIHFKIRQYHDIVNINTDDRGGEYCDIHYNFTNLGTAELDYDIMIRMDPIHGNMPSDPTLDNTQMTGSQLVDFTHGETGTMICNPQDFPNLNCDVTAIVSGNYVVNTPSSVYYGNMHHANPGYPSFNHMDGTTPLSPDPSTINYHYVTAWMGNKVAAGSSYEINTLYGVSYPYAGGGSSGSASNSELWIQSGSSMYSGFFLPLVTATSKNIGIKAVDISTPQGSQKAISSADSAIAAVSRFRSQFGAYQNRMEHALENAGNQVENQQAAESRIRDTDMADEFVRYSMQQILGQASQAMLAQANSSQDKILSLFQ